LLQGCRRLFGQLLVTFAILADRDLTRFAILDEGVFQDRELDEISAGRLLTTSNG